ncbi:hypothetical protein OAL10_03890 [Gammaproteobacteria bacterium]|nr:hypothetical protein [Gammaproteobacteria bacterium]
MFFRIIALFYFTFLVSCSVTRHEILGTNYGWNASGIQVLLDASINKLRVRHVRRAMEQCVGGYSDHLEISGEIGPDSTAAISRLLPQLGQCTNAQGDRLANIVFLSSGGGYLSDGYALGELFKQYEVQTFITGKQICASSCAIAFLGGKYRTMEHDAVLLFHAPYTSNGIAIDCSDTGQVAGLKKYYYNTLGKKDGDFLLDRTLSYCSAGSGWTLNADGAKLFGITKE